MRWHTAVVVVALLGACGDGGDAATTTTTERTTETSKESTSTTARPTTTTSLMPGEVAALLATPCATEGETVPGFDAPAYGDIFISGLRCTGGTWAVVDSAGESCSDYPISGPWVTAEGAPLTCIDEELFGEGQQRTSFYNGNFEVGTGVGQVPPGTYEAHDVTDCYWELVDGSGETLDNNFITGAPTARFSVPASAAGVNIDGGCGEWRKVG